MRKPDGSVDSPDERKRKPWRSLYLLNVGAIALSIAILGGFLIVSIFEAFATSSASGVRSLAATLLPPIAITYTTFFTRVLKPPENVPVFNLYFVYTIWTAVALILAGVYMQQRFPAGELALSITLSILIIQWRSLSFQAFISCCYGIISGFLLYVLIRGV